MKTKDKVFINSEQINHQNNQSMKHLQIRVKKPPTFRYNEKNLIYLFTLT